MTNELEEKIEAFFFKNKKLHFRKGELLIRAEEDPNGIFYLEKGSVRQYVISRKGEEVVVNTFKESAFFPMSWAFNKTPNTFFFEALEDAEVYKATTDSVMTFLRSNSDVLYDLLTRVYRGVDGLLKRMVYLMSGDAYGRLVTELVIYAKRFGNKTGSIEVMISERDLASQTGMTRETVSREIKILKEKKLIEFSRNKLTIPDLKKLENELVDGV